MMSQPRRRTWVWFFVALALLAVAAIIIPLIAVPMVHGLVPVTRENLQAARTLWERNGLRDYDMEYRKKGSVGGEFKVQVRNGQGVSVLMDNQPLDRSSNPNAFDFHTMTALFKDLERLLEMSEKPGASPVVLRARFDPVDGHIIRYIYSVNGTPQQIQVSVRLQRLDSVDLAK
jgi:hypothetical protein